MGNKILGKRSRNFYKGFNERQLDYLKEKFESLSENGELIKNKFIEAYQLDDNLYSAFLTTANFDDEGGIDQYQFICMMSYLCNLTTQELGSKFFEMLGKGRPLKVETLFSFTSVALRYNAYLQGKELTKKQIENINKKKFKQYDYDKSQSIQCGQFCSICMKDKDYKNWMFNMGFITKNQMDHHDMIYDLVDSDIEDEVERQLKGTNPNVDRIKRGIENRQQDDQFQVQAEVGQQSAPPKPKPWTKGFKDIQDKYYQGVGTKISEEAPSQLMNLQYVLGYRSFDCRNNLRFDQSDRIIYHQAALGIRLQQLKSAWTQTFLNSHKDDITCLDGIGNRIVTGESGTAPMIIIWNSDKDDNGALKSQFIITKDLKESVGTVCFSPSGNLIAATCNDQNHSLVVYDINQLKALEENLTSTKTGIVASGPLVKCLVFDIRFELGKSQDSLAVATIRQLLFVNLQKGVINSSRGDYGNFSTSMALCLLPLETKNVGQGKKNLMIAGMGNGSIYFWERGKCIKAIVGHTGSVSALCKQSKGNSFISGDKTGKIITWNDQFSKENVIDLPKTNSPSNMIVSLSQGTKKQLLIGTKGSSIFLLKNGGKASDIEQVMRGHSDGMIWSATIGGYYLYTGGEDRRIIQWDYRSSKQAVKQIKCQYSIRSLDFLKRQKLLAVGFYNGVIKLYKAQTLEEIKDLTFTKIKNPDQQVLNIVKFQIRGAFLAASYSYPSPKIIFFNFQKTITKIGEIELKDKVIAFDISDSKDLKKISLRCNTKSSEGQTYSLYQLQLDNKKITSSLRKQKILNEGWQTHTCPFTPETQGFFSEGVEEKDIACCARSLKYRNVIIAGDRYSKLKLFNYPTPKNKIFNKYEGHSNEVTFLQFNQQEDHVISIGGEEKAIFIWAFDPMEVKNDYVVNFLEQYQQKKEEKEEEEQDEDMKVQKVKGECATSTGLKGNIIAPSDFISNPRKDNRLPEVDAKIHHVFGIRNQYINDEVRNQGKFTADGEGILFPTACMAVKMDIKSKTQQIMLQHKQDIVSFAVDQTKTVMATGQMAEKNLKNPRKKILSIYVWDIETKKSLVQLDGFHTIAVVLLDFSPSGKLLFSCGHDEKNSFAVYDWRAKTILYSGPVSRAKVNGIAWKSQTQFATCGLDHIKLWEKGKGRLCQFPAKSTFQAQFCVVNSGGAYITGGALGNIYVWKSNTSSTCLKVKHEGKVQCLSVRQKFVYSGGNDGTIIKWAKQADGSIEKGSVLLDLRATFAKMRIKQITEDEFAILSIDFKIDQKNDNDILLITKGCSAIVCRSGKLQVITQGHYSGELWGLASSKGKKDAFVTGGDDGSLRIWSVQQRRQLCRTNFDQIIRGVDWSPLGDKIVCAYGQASIQLLSDTLSPLSQKVYQTPPPQNPKSLKNTKSGKYERNQQIVQQIKFSPDGEKIFYGTHGQSKIIYFLTVQKTELKLLKKIDYAISSALLHADWSKNSSVVSINSQAPEIRFFGIDGSNPSASSLRNESWATWTQKFGFPVQGIFQGSDYSDVNTVCRDPYSNKFLAVGYDDQCIRLFRYPCYIPKQVHKTLYGHSSHVTRVRFNDKYMISIGGLDRTIIVWDLEGPDFENQLKEKEKNQNNQSDDQLSDLDEDVDIPRKIMTNRNKKKKKQIQEEFMEIEQEGDQFGAVKPWLGAIKQPTYKYPKQTAKKPNSKIELEYVHGYRTKDCRQNLFFKNEQTLIFHAAAVLIYQDISKPDQGNQYLITDHADDILSIDYHRSTEGVITGELGPKPLINYYRGQQRKLIFKAPVSKGVLALAINPTGNLAVAAGMDDDHYIAVLDLNNGQVLAKEKGGKKVILKAGWTSDENFVTVGIRHFKYWSFTGKGCKGKDGNQPDNLVSLAIENDLVLTGASQGKIYSWKGSNGSLKTTLVKPERYRSDQQKKSQQIYPISVVESIKIIKNGIVAGTKDGYIFILNKQYETINAYHLNDLVKPKLASQHPSIRSIDILENKLLIGTFGSEIFTFQVENIMKQKASFKNAVCHMKGHYSPNNSWTNEVWGLHVDGDLAFTCSDDATLRCWSIPKKKLLSIASLNLTGNSKFWSVQAKNDKTNDFQQNAKGRSVCISPDRNYIIVGCKDGTVRIFKFDQKTYQIRMFLMFKDAKEWISQIKFGFNLLIIGSHDNGIYVYDYDYDPQNKVAKFAKKYKPMKKHSSYITHCDVSRDSCYLQSTCGAYQLLFWDLNTGKQITGGASMLKDQRWATWTCNLGWPVQGIYPKCTDGTFIHSVDRSNSSIKGTNFKGDPTTPYLLAGGNNKGEVCLYNYPCTVKNSQYVIGRGHSSHITNVRWTGDDQRVISVGGEDQCVMYWTVKK